MLTEFNVVGVPEDLSVNIDAALGVAFVRLRTLLAIDISLSFNFANVRQMK